MHHFAYRAGVMHAEAVDLTSLAEAVGTPFYCYSTATLTRHYRVFADAFADVPSLVQRSSLREFGSVATKYTLDPAAVNCLTAPGPPIRSVGDGRHGNRQAKGEARKRGLPNGLVLPVCYSCWT